MDDAIASDSDRGLDRALALLIAVASDGDKRPIAAHAEDAGVPLSTAYRLVGQLVRHGLLAPAQRGHFGPGLALERLAAGTSRTAILAATARPLVRRLARRARATAHLGVIESDMVTYIVKERGGGPDWFTREDGQLEAYCSAIGKMLLSAYPEDRLNAYLASAPFVPLTARTVIDPSAIRSEVELVRAAGFAIDDREVADDLVCVAVPIRGPADVIVAAISISRPAAPETPRIPSADLLACAAAIEGRLGLHRLR